MRAARCARPYNERSSIYRKKGDVMDLKWAYITFGAGILIIVIEYIMASKKKGGVTATDKKSMTGLFWLAIGAAALVAFLTNA